jgi:hypothetical protein
MILLWLRVSTPRWGRGDSFTHLRPGWIPLPLWVFRRVAAVDADSTLCVRAVLCWRKSNSSRWQRGDNRVKRANTSAAMLWVIAFDVRVCVCAARGDRGRVSGCRIWRRRGRMAAMAAFAVRCRGSRSAGGGVALAPSSEKLRVARPAETKRPDSEVRTEMGRCRSRVGGRKVAPWPRVAADRGVSRGRQARVRGHPSERSQSHSAARLLEVADRVRIKWRSDVSEAAETEG